MTQSQLADASLLPQRTVRHALNKLEEANIVEESIYIMDARKSNYHLTDKDGTRADAVTV